MRSEGALLSGPSCCLCVPRMTAFVTLGCTPRESWPWVDLQLEEQDCARGLSARGRWKARSLAKQLRKGHIRVKAKKNSHSGPSPEVLWS